MPVSKVPASLHPNPHPDPEARLPCLPAVVHSTMYVVCRRIWLMEWETWSGVAVWQAWLAWLAWSWWRVAGATGRALEVLWKAARNLPCRMAGEQTDRQAGTRCGTSCTAWRPSPHGFPHRFPKFATRPPYCDGNARESVFTVSPMPPCALRTTPTPTPAADLRHRAAAEWPWCPWCLCWLRWMTV